mmetsp:Transcript_116779/g.376909  ORF Transcript_116779/g.376909 Transcript_116779/m.376909 type:complete len:338 (+) Transcript_116779:55-1068(+)
MSSKKGGEAKGKAKVEDKSTAETKRITKAIEEASSRLPEKVAPYVKKAAPFLATAWIYFLAALPHIVKAVGAAQDFVATLPEGALWAILGFVVCFFGGVFPATIAAFEAARLCGVKEALLYCRELNQEWLKVKDAKTNDGESVLDLSQAGTPDFVAKRAQLVLKAVDPEKVNTSLVGLYTGWVGVIAALKIRFAKTVTLGAVIGEALYQPASKMEPALQAVVPEEYHRWIPVTVAWVCKAVAVTFAWWLERIFAALHSAVRGGALFGEHLVRFLREKGVLKVGPEETRIDELAGWAVAVLGFLFQLYNGFHVPFPLSLFLWPVQLVEAIIVWSVSMA